MARRDAAGPAVRRSRAPGDACGHHRRHPVPRPGHRCEHGDLLAGQRPAPPQPADPGRRSSGHAQRRQHEPAVHVRHLRGDSTSRPSLRRRAGLGRVRPDDRGGGGAGVRAMGERRLLRHLGVRRSPAARSHRPTTWRAEARAGAGRGHQPRPLATPFRWGAGRDRPLAPRRGRGGDRGRRSAPGFHGVLVGSAFDLLLPVRINDLIRSTTASDVLHAPWLRILLRLRPGQSMGAATAALQAAQPQIRSRSHPPGPLGDAFLSEPFAVESAARGVSDLRRRYSQATRGPSRGGVPGSAGGLHERRQHPAGARGRTPPRAEPAGRAGRLARAARSAVPPRERCAGAARRASSASCSPGGRPARWSPSSPGGEVPIVLDLDVDLRVLAYTASVAVAAALVAGLAPALWANDRPPPRRLAGRRARRWRRRTGARGFGTLQVAQVAVSVLLLVAAGLFGRTFQRLADAPLGFDADRLLVATVRTPTTPPADQSEIRHRLARAVASIPGVAAAGGSDQAPLYYYLLRPSPSACPASHRLPGRGHHDAHGSGHPRVVRGVRPADAGGTPHRGTGRSPAPRR